MQVIFWLFLRLLAVLAMIGFWFFMHWLTTGFGSQFSAGLVTGMMLMLGIFYAVWKVDPDAFRDRRRK